MRFLKRLFLFLILLIVIGLVIISMSPYPMSLLVRKMFDGGVAVAPNNFDEIERRVAIEVDLEFPSNFSDNTYDYFYPKNATGVLPTVIWVHGGAFVGGDKHDIYEYAIQIADKGYRVISMNYKRAPEASYPTPLLQVSEMTQYLLSDSKFEGNVSKDQLIYAGDSAGAHIAAQFAMIQNDEAYAKLTGIEPTLEKNTILGMLLYCGPYDIDALVKRANESKILDFFAGKIAWGYLGNKNWKTSDEVSSLSILKHVNENFPKSFITDGNKGSFTQHGIDLVEKLQNMGVETHSKFYDVNTAELQHEYQFMMNLEESVETFEATIEFLKTLH